MAHTDQREAAQAEHKQGTWNPQSPPPPTELHLLLITILKMLEPYVRQANIALKNGERVSICEDWEMPTQFHCGNEKRPCADLEMVETPRGEMIALCRNLMTSSNLGARLERIKPASKSRTKPRSRLSPVLPDETQVEFETVTEDVEMRQQIIKRAKDVIEIMSAEERAILLSGFGESEFNLFLEQSDDVERLQLIQYNFTRRINNIKTQGRKRQPRRPVIEQRKVGDYLYKLQSTQKGASYWYIQFTKDGQRIHKYLGKERPSFDPKKDLDQKSGAKMKAAAAGR